MKRQDYTKINYKWSDCKVRQLGEVVTITYYGETLCVISEVIDLNEILSLIKCMFQEGIMYPKITSYKLRKLFKDSVKPKLRLLEKKVDDVIDTVQSVTIQNVVERSVFNVKKVVYFFRRKKVNSMTIGENSKRFSSPIPNLRFNLRKK